MTHAMRGVYAAANSLCGSPYMTLHALGQQSRDQAHHGRPTERPQQCCVANKLLLCHVKYNSINLSRATSVLSSLSSAHLYLRVGGRKSTVGYALIA